MLHRCTSSPLLLFWGSVVLSFFFFFMMFIWYGLFSQAGEIAHSKGTVTQTDQGSANHPFPETCLGLRLANDREEGSLAGNVPAHIPA